MKKILKICFIVFIIICGFCFLIYNNETIELINSVTERCIYKVFPSLFCFMIVTSFLLDSGVCSRILLPIKPISKYVFGMDLEVFSAFVFSLFAGYPSGANLVVKLYNSKKINEKQAKLYSACFYCGGPAFIFGLYGNVIGKYVYISIISANIVTVLILNNLLFRKYKSSNSKSYISVNANTLINSINTSFVCLSKVCAMIVAFAFMSLPIKHIITNTSFYPFLEISNIADIYIYPVLATAMFSLGGICVIMQVKMILNELMDIPIFLTVRAINAIMSGIIMSILQNLIPNSSIATMLTIQTSKSYQYGILPIIFCFIMSVLLLYETEKKIKIGT